MCNTRVDGGVHLHRVLGLRRGRRDRLPALVDFGQRPAATVFWAFLTGGQGRA